MSKKYKEETILVKEHGRVNKVKVVRERLEGCKTCKINYKRNGSAYCQECADNYKLNTVK